jgi:pimeloyl-ACP methyl ester carboxylesterase
MKLTLHLEAGLVADEYAPEQHAAERPVIVLLPSIGLSRRSWADCAAVLGQTFRTLAVDPPGQGGSPPGSCFLTISDLALAVGDAVDAVGATRIVLVGNSMGATIGASLAIARPELVRTLVLVGSFVMPDEAARHDWLRSRSSLFFNPDGSLKPVTAQFVETVFGEYDAHRHRMMAEDIADAGVGLGWAMWALYSYDAAAELELIKQPVLAVFGERDPLRDTSLPVLRERLPGLHEAVVSRGSHLLPMDKPHELAAVISHWIETRLTATTEAIDT